MAVPATTVRRTPTRRRAVVGPPRLVGRDPELAALREALADPPAVVLVEGEAGIGKSRLVHECLAASRDRVLVAGCPPFREPLTLAPIVDAVRAATDSLRGLDLTGLAGALRPVFPEWADHLPAAPEPAEDAAASRHRLFRALTELLTTLDVAVLVVEDVHWADEATLGFLLFLTSHRPVPVSLLLTYRPEDVPDGSLLLRLSARLPAGVTKARIDLGPLDVDGTAGLVSSMLAGEPLSEEFAAFLYERTDGVPLAVEETVRLMHDRTDLTRLDGQWARRHLADIAVPPSIRDAVQARADRLGANAQAVLRAAAVLGELSDDLTLSAVAAPHHDRFEAGLTEALGSGLLREDSRGLVGFQHALAAKAVYEAVPGRERRAMHARAGHALERQSPQPVARLARHFREAGDTDHRLLYGERAADMARAVGDEASASALLYDLVVHAELPARTVVRLIGKIGVVSLAGTRLQGLVTALRAAAQARELSPGEVAEVRCLLGRFLISMEEYDAGRVELERAVPDLEHDPKLAVRAMLGLGWPYGGTSSMATYRGWLDRAAELMARMEPDDRLVFAIDHATALLTLGDEAGWSEAEQIPQGDLPAQQAQDAGRGQANLGDLAMRWGRYADARRRLSNALHIAVAREYVRLQDNVLVIRAHLDWFTGEWEGLAERTRALADDHDLHPATRMEVVLVTGLLQYTTGETRHGEEHVRAAANTARRWASPLWMEPAGALARLYLSQGRIDDAIQVTDEPVGVLTREDIWLWATEIAPARMEALRAAGREHEATDLVTAFGRGLYGLTAPAPRAALTLCRAILAEGRGQQARAAALFARAADAWQALPRPYDALLARERQAHCLLAIERRDDAVVALTHVRQGMATLGATGDEDRVTGTLRQQGVRVRRTQTGRPSYGDQLSPRELDVVRLLVDGRTNRKIAEVLVLTPATVNSHVKSAMRKFQVSSRTAVAVRAVELGLVAPDES